MNDAKVRTTARKQSSFGEISALPPESRRQYQACLFITDEENQFALMLTARVTSKCHTKNSSRGNTEGELYFGRRKINRKLGRCYYVNQEIMSRILKTSICCQPTMLFSFFCMNGLSLTWLFMGFSISVLNASRFITIHIHLKFSHSNFTRKICS